MSAYRRPLKRSILIAIGLFITVLCLVLSLVQYFNFSRSLYSRYEEYIGNILNYAASGIDVDDLAQCIRTGEESEKFQRLQLFLDNLRENTAMHFLYVIIPLNTEPVDNIQNVIAAVTRDEYENMADELVHLNQLTGDSYAPETAKKYLEAYESGHLSFFEEVSEWGDDYTGLLPLYDSSGNRVAALCMDGDILEIHTILKGHTTNTISIIIMLGVLFAIVFFIWIDINITHPIKLLETSVVRFAERSHQQRDMNALVLDMPEIHTDNEVESLAHAVVRMSENMRDYVSDIIDAEKELAKMNVIAHRDAMTNVGNKTAYEQYVEGLNRQIEAGAAEFAIVMMDMNDLKRINDGCGHEKGDLYLKKGCAVFREIYRHSPVFRVGGDEFVAVLQGQDYERRYTLMECARRDFANTLKGGREDCPWERLSVAIGMAEYDPEANERVEDVMNRADRSMYDEKGRMKARDRA